MRLEPNAKVLAIRPDSAETILAYPLSQPSRIVQQDSIVVFINGEKEIGNAFYAGEHTLQFIDGAFVDSTTSGQQSLAGVAVSESLTGMQLEALPTKVSYWFAIVAAEPQITLVTK